MFVILGLCAVLNTQDIYGGQTSLPVLGRDAISNPLIVEDHSQTLTD
jgi:hypothetical protein